MVVNASNHESASLGGSSDQKGWGHITRNSSSSLVGQPIYWYLRKLGEDKLNRFDVTGGFVSVSKKIYSTKVSKIKEMERSANVIES